MRSLVSVRCLGLVLVAATACEANNPTYFPPMGPLEGGMGMGMMPGAGSSLVTLPFRRPTEEEQAALTAERQRLGQTVPWLRSERVAISVLYTITNLADRPGVATVMVNGASEFASYDPQALAAAAVAANAMVMGGEEQNENFLSLIQPTPMPVPAGGTVSGIVREDDFAEASLDLDAIGRWMATPAAVLINRSEVNPVGLEMVPAGLVVPAMFQVQVAFSSSTHMRLEFLVRVRDEERQLLGNGDQAFQPRPRAYAPAAPMPMPP
jgi:hypothetical protein